jgi:spermidine/putrescine transport system substrate-binding protein
MAVLRVVTRVLIVLFWSVCTLFLLRAPDFLSKKPASSLTILVWPNILDRDLFSVFEKRTGIKVYVAYFENYEELFVKLKNGGALGYDMVMTSDYMAELLIKEKVLEKLDKKRCPFFDRINRSFLGNYCDPQNDFTVPYALSLYGLGVDLDAFGGVVKDPSWSLLFNTDHVGMPDDAREVILIAAQYLFGSIDNLTDQKLDQIKTMLREQKKRVEMYTDLRTDYLLFSKTASVVAAMHPDLAHAIKKTSNIKFLLPKEGVFAVLDSMALVKGSVSTDAAYLLLNFLYEQSVMDYYVKEYKFIPALSDVACPDLQLGVDERNIIDSVCFFRNVISPEKLMDCWISVKS